MEQRRELIEAAAEIVVAYVSKNPIATTELPRLIQQTAAALAALGQNQPQAVAPSEPQKPAVPIKKSLNPEHITCLEDGKQFRSLKRHLKTSHNLTPAEYRAKWGLPKNYPMIAPSYFERRSSLARQFGLGQKSKGGQP